MGEIGEMVMVSGGGGICCEDMDEQNLPTSIW